MPRLWIAAMSLGLPAGGVMPAQENQGPPRRTNCGTTTITSFDKDHTVVGWLDIIPFESKIFHNTRMLRVLVPANYALAA